MQEDPGHAERVGHQAGMLAAGAAEAVEGVFGYVVAALDRDLLDRVGHVLDRDAQEALGHLLGRLLGLVGGRGDLPRQHREFLVHHLGVERLVGGRAEHPRKVGRLDLAQHHVAVGDRQRPTAAVAGRTRIGASGLRADAVARAVEVQDRAAAGRHRVDAHHGRTHAHPGHQGLEGALVFAVVVGHVGRGAAHVEGDDLVEAAHGRGLHGADDAAGRAGQDRVLALEQAGVGQPAVRLHEHEPRIAQFARHLIHIAPQDRRKVGIHHGGVAPAHQLHQRADLVAHRDLAEADGAGQRRRPALVLGKAVAVHEHDGDRAEALVEGILQVAAQGVFVRNRQHFAASRHAFVDFDHPAVEQLRQHDLAGEEMRAVLVADAQRVPEALGDHQERALALAFEQRVGGDGGAHLDGLDGLGGDPLLAIQAEQRADALQRRVAVALRVLRQELVGHQAAVGTARHHVGEGAAPVDPELPTAVAPIGRPLVIFAASLTLALPSSLGPSYPSAASPAEFNEYIL